jgi:type II secretory pathway pseudopilin PulG
MENPLSKINSTKRRALEAFTLLEVAVALGVMGIFASMNVSSFSQFNRAASASRLQTLATALAQQKIEQIVTAPWAVDSAAPVLLNNSTETISLTNNPLAEGNPNTNNRSSEFSSLDGDISAQRVTVFKNVINPATNVGTLTNFKKATVTVSYVFRGKPYSVVMNTFRAPSDF